MRQSLTLEASRGGRSYNLGSRYLLVDADGRKGFFFTISVTIVTIESTFVVVLICVFVCPILNFVFCFGAHFCLVSVLEVETTVRLLRIRVE